MLDLSCFKSRFSRVGEMFARRAAMARLQRELQDSSDRALAEIGLARSDIAAVVNGRFGRP